MRRPSFVHGVGVAAALAFLTSALFAALIPFVGLGSVLRLVIPLLAFAYLLYLFSNSSERIGRVITLTAWSLLAVATWWFSPPLPLVFLIHATSIWIIRSLYFYSGLFSSLLDLGLSALSVIATTWAIAHTGSVFLATWSFFLVQAAFVGIPASMTSINKRRKASCDRNVVDDAFARARRDAESALRQLYTH